MKLKQVEKTVKEVLENNIDSRNDNFVLVLEVYKKLEVPVTTNFMGLMIEHNKYELPPFESVMRARRKIVSEFPELQSTKKIKEKRKEQEESYREYAIGG